uniref:AB hydrolase-1 domain-containing protein n=1 Tax=Oryza punctata TaxID=4537 RepID=A0A0E0M9A2_ORYPU
MADQIEHLHLPIRGINLHIAQVGKDELGTVVFLHGLPEIWYSWRHQMLAAAAAGYRAVAPDWRGYGLSGQPPEQEEATWDDLVADVLAILDALAVPRAFLVGKDFGAMPAYDFALRHPERTRGVACLGVPFSPVPPSFDAMPEGFYVLRWREAGRAEADFARHDVRRVVRTIYILFAGADIPIAKEGQEIMDLADTSTPLPPWLTEADLDVYTSLYENSGFRFPLQMPYRAINRRMSQMDARFEVPVLLVMGEKDYAFKFPGFEAAVRGGAMERFAAELKVEFLPEGSHFAQEQLPEQVNQLLLGFFAEHPAMATTAEEQQQHIIIEHVHLAVRGLRLHVAQAGKGELGTVMFLHGFPEIWYSWHHQMLAVAAAGYHAIAPDWRGYGLSEQPPEPEAAEFDDLIEDLLAILDALAVPKAFLVAQDFGSIVAYDFALCHSNRICGVISLGIPFGITNLPLNTLPEGFYVSRWRQPGRAEADFSQYDVNRVMRTIYILFSRSEIPIAKEGQEIMDLVDLSTPLPEWFTEKDLIVYSSLYEESGFRYPLQMPCRSLHTRKPIENVKFQVPVFVVMGEKDYVFKFPGIKLLLKGGSMEKLAPDLKITYIPEGGHFVQEQFPDYVNELLLGFLKSHPVLRDGYLVDGEEELDRAGQRAGRKPWPRRSSRSSTSTSPCGGSASTSRKPAKLGTVVFLHGFPEIWYSWRHQMLAVAAAGYRAVAPDWRGYGLSDQPPEPEAAEYDDLIEDLLAILDALAVPKAFLVGKDFGAMPAYDFALRHPNRIYGVMCLGIPLGTAGLSFGTLPEGFYIFRWAQPGRAEADFSKYNVKRVVRTIYILFSRSEIPIAKEDQEIMDLVDLSTPLPEWFSEENLDVYSSLYEKSGFRYPLQMPYRSLHQRKPIGDAKFQVPVFVVMGEKDYVFKFPGIESAMKDGTMEKHAPNIKITYIPEGGHFVQEQFPDYVNELLLGFLKDHRSSKLAMAATTEQQQQTIIEHVHLPVRGLRLHVAQAGKGELGTVVFLHGFPEIWYSWRHQMLAVAAAGYRAIAPDWRGYGLSDQPPEPEAAEFDDLIEDLLAILDALAVPKEEQRLILVDIVSRELSEIPIAKKDQEIMDLADLSTPLPEWFTEEDLNVYSSFYEKSGFQYPLQMPYRSLHKRKPIEDVKFQVPVFIVMGEKDYIFKVPGIESIMKDNNMKKIAPGLKIIYIPEGGHFVQEQFPHQVNELLLGFLKDHRVASPSHTRTVTSPLQSALLRGAIPSIPRRGARSSGAASRAEAMATAEQQIEHVHLPVRGLSLHVAQAGEGLAASLIVRADRFALPVPARLAAADRELGTVVFLHGFPEIWYSFLRFVLCLLGLYTRENIGDAKFQVLLFVVMREKDYAFTIPSIEFVMKDGSMEKHAPKLKITYIPEGCHFVQEQFPEYWRECRGSYSALH